MLLSHLVSAGFLTLGVISTAMVAVVAFVLLAKARCIPPLNRALCPAHWVVCLMFSLLFLATGILQLAKAIGYTEASVMAILIVIPLLLAISRTRREGLRRGGSSHFVYPEVHPAGEPLAVELRVEPSGWFAGLATDRLNASPSHGELAHVQLSSKRYCNPSGDTLKSSRSRHSSNPCHRRAGVHD